MKLAATAFLAIGLAVAAAPATAQVYYTLNGQVPPPNIQMAMASNGLPPGHYWLDGAGNWGVVGNPMPLGNINAGAQAQQGYGGGGQYVTPGGSGQVGPNGAWGHYTENPTGGGGFGVGGTGDGCVYTTSGWSNC